MLVIILLTWLDGIAIDGPRDLHAERQFHAVHTERGSVHLSAPLWGTGPPRFRVHSIA